MSSTTTAALATTETRNDIAATASNYAHWALRIALASVFVYHGADKLAALDAFAQMTGMSSVMALMVALAEFVGGVLILAGSVTRDWITRLGAAMFIPVMLGAIGMVHWGQWAFMASPSHPMGGAEFQTTLLLLSVYFVLKGNRA